MPTFLADEGPISIRSLFVVSLGAAMSFKETALGSPKIPGKTLESLGTGPGCYRVWLLWELLWPQMQAGWRPWCRRHLAVLLKGLESCR